MITRIVRNDQDAVTLANWFARLQIASPKVVTVDDYRPKRSDEQHRTFWLWCGHVARVLTEAGHTCSKDEIHDVVLMHVYGTRRSEIRPELVYPSRTLTKPRKLNKQEMSDLLEAFQCYAAEKGILLPDPSDHYGVAA